MTVIAEVLIGVALGLVVPVSLYLWLRGQRRAESAIRRRHGDDGTADRSDT